MATAKKAAAKKAAAKKEPESKPAAKSSDSSAKPAAKKADKNPDTLEDVRRAQGIHVFHQRAEVDTDVHGFDDDDVIVVSTEQGVCTLSIGKSSVRLDQDGVIDLRKKLDAAFQAVS